MPFERYRDPVLPWGQWFLIDAEGDPLRQLIDENGDRWFSLRDALWTHRLGRGRSSRLGNDRTERPSS